MKYQNKHNQALQTIIWSFMLPLGFLSCKGNGGKAGITPTVLVAGVECTRTGSDMRIIIANAFDVNAQFAEYTNPQVFSDDAYPTQWPAIFCTSGNQIWTNQSPIIASAHASTVASLSCSSISPDDGGTPNYDFNTIGCNIEVGQPIECLAAPSMPGFGVGNLSAINFSTVFCVDDIEPLGGISIEALIEGAGSPTPPPATTI